MIANWTPNYRENQLVETQAFSVSRRIPRDQDCPVSRQSVQFQETAPRWSQYQGRSGILGHLHLSTTPDLHMRVDQNVMVRALVAAKVSGERAATKKHSSVSSTAAQYVFPYNAQTVHELEHAIEQAGSSTAESRRQEIPPKRDLRLGRVEPADQDS